MKKLVASLFAALGIGTTAVNSQPLYEAPAGFDSDIVEPFLERLNIEKDLGEVSARATAANKSINQ